MEKQRGEIAFVEKYEEMCQWKIRTTHTIKTIDDLLQIGQHEDMDFTYSNRTVESKWRVTASFIRGGKAKVWIRIGLLHLDFVDNDNASTPKEGNFLATIRNFAGTLLFEGSSTSSINNSFLIRRRHYKWEQIELTEKVFRAMQIDGGGGGWSMTVTLSIKTKTNIHISNINGGPLLVDKDQFYRMITKLENDKENSDVKIISSDAKEFFAYRWILSGTSDVFNSMFKSDMEEKKTGVIKMDDLSGKTVKTLLHFIYTKEVGVEWSTPGTVEELIYAVDKYQIQELKNFLDVNLGKVCCLQNAGNLLALAEKTGMKKAEVDILAFIRENCKNAAGYFKLVKHTIIN